MIEDSILDDKQNNFIVALCTLKDVYGLAATDLSTGRFEITEIPRGSGDEAVRSEIWRLHPSEILFADGQELELRGLIDPELSPFISIRPDSHFRQSMARGVVCEQLGVSNLSGFGAEDHTASVSAAGAMLEYLRESQKTLLQHVDGVAGLQCARLYGAGLDDAAEFGVGGRGFTAGRKGRCCGCWTARRHRWGGGSCGSGFYSR